MSKSNMLRETLNSSASDEDETKATSTNTGTQGPNSDPILLDVKKL